MSDNAYIINAITGESVSTNVKFFMSFDEFKDFISQKWSIPHDQLLILLPFGNKLKISSFKECLRSNIAEKNEFYVYDRRLFSMVHEPTGEKNEDSVDNKDEGLTPQAQTLLHSLVKNGPPNGETALLKPINSPLVDSDLKLQNLNYRTIISLLTTNLGWLSALEIDVHYFRLLIEGYLAQTAEILKCLSICEQYLKLYCYDVEKLYNSNVEFLNQLAQNGLSSKWKDCYNSVLNKLEGLEGPLQQYIDKKSLESNEANLKQLDQNVNSKLKKAKKELDANAELRAQISENIELLRMDFTPENVEDKLEKTMLERFDELVEETRRRSRDIIDQDPVDFTDDNIEEVHSFLSRNKSEVSGKLFTIAQALYVQTESVLERKRNLQTKAVIILGQIAFVQVETLGIKRILLTDCNKDLESYQMHEFEFAQVEDLPLIYGLYLIEKYRRECWFLQVISHISALASNLKRIKGKESNCRSKWNENFGSIASMFCNDLESYADFENLDNLFVGGLLDFQLISNEKVTLTKDSLNTTLEIIEGYLAQLPLLHVSKDVTEVLSQNLSDAKKFQVSINSSQVQDSKVSTSGQINGYRARIKKLESLLHDARYSDPGHWPSGVLNATYMKPFHNNISTVGSKNSSTILEPNRESSAVKMLEMEANLQELQEKVNALNQENEAKAMQISFANTRISDLKLEKTAFKETLTNLNKELGRLTHEEELTQNLLLTRQGDFKKQIGTVIQENKFLLREINKWREKHDTLNASRKDATSRISQMENNFAKEKEALQENAAILQENIVKLKNQVDTLENDNTELRAKQEKEEVCTHEPHDEGGSTSSKEPLKDESLTEIHNHNGYMESKIFDIFASDVYILENIGLLLSLDDAKNIQIKRVKGLRKGQNQSVLDDSVQITDTDASVKSTVFHGIKQIYEDVRKTDDLEKHQQLVVNINKLYEDKRYENAVIKRFKDIESLAKKLTKENKKKRGLLETYQNERITLKNFQIGDLALFLPTRDSGSPMESSVSSLNSSFSSVDLSTPPPFEAAPLHPSPAGKEKSKKKSKNRPWAAFTAFEDNTRYFLKDEGEYAKDKEWFVGRILSLENFIADGPNNNPYKLAKDSVWFQVTAKMISCQG